jgi:hypothetical protein
MDRDNEMMMMELLMQDEADATAEQRTLDDGSNRYAVLSRAACRRSSSWWFQGWEGEEQESAMTCRCSFA